MEGEGVDDAGIMKPSLSSTKPSGVERDELSFRFGEGGAGEDDSGTKKPSASSLKPSGRGEEEGDRDCWDREKRLLSRL